MLQDFLEHSACRVPGKVALVCGDERWTYAEIESMANRVAWWLGALGLRRGERVVVLCGNRVETVVAFFGVIKAGGIAVVLNPTLKPSRLGFIVNQCQAVGIIGFAKLLRRPEVMEALVSSSLAWWLSEAHETHGRFTPKPFMTLTEVLQSGNDARFPRVGIDLDLACLIYTSGSTGEPKGVMCGHDNMVFATRAIAGYLGQTEGDVILSVLPLSFTYGLYQMLTAFLAGGTLVLENSFAYPAEVLSRVPKERITGFPGVPTIYAVLLGMDLSAFDLSSIRYLTNAAAPLAPETVLEIARRFPKAQFYSMYGQTETARTLYLPPEWVTRKPGAVGVAIPGTEVWIEDEQGRRVERSVVGELVVRGRNVMRGYWGEAEATARRFVPGPWPGERVCRTGDLFRVDDDGLLHFVSRTDDLLKCKGEKVAPREVELVLLQMKGIRQAAVVGVPDPVLGHAVKAVLVAGTEAVPSVAEVLAHCRRYLEDHMVPRLVEFREELPVTANGKVMRKELV